MRNHHPDRHRRWLGQRLPALRHVDVTLTRSEGHVLRPRRRGRPLLLVFASPCLLLRARHSHERPFTCPTLSWLSWLSSPVRGRHAHRLGRPPGMLAARAAWRRLRGRASSSGLGPARTERSSPGLRSPSGRSFSSLTMGSPRALWRSGTGGTDAAARSFPFPHRLVDVWSRLWASAVSVIEPAPTPRAQPPHSAVHRALRGASEYQDPADAGARRPPDPLRPPSSASSRVTGASPDPPS